MTTKTNVNSMTPREFRAHLEAEYTDSSWPQVVKDRVWNLTYDNSKGEPRETQECIYYEYVLLAELARDSFHR